MPPITASSTPYSFGNTDKQERVQAIPLRSSALHATILTYGAIIKDLRMAGFDHSLVLGFEDLESYRRDTESVGAICGPVVNRIGHAQFSIDGTPYSVEANIDGGHCLHSGSARLSKVNWSIQDVQKDQVTLNYAQKDGAGGFPGPVEYQITYKLDHQALHVIIDGKPSQNTPLSVTQHSYFNLGNTANIRLDHVTIHADHILETGPGIIPTGKLLDIDGTTLDFRDGKSLMDAGHPMDHTFIPEATESGILRPVAEITPHQFGPTMKVLSDQPAFQLYDGAHLTPPFSPHQGVCFECHGYPNALNIEAFPSMIFGPDRPYHAHTVYAFKA